LRSTKATPTSSKRTTEALEPRQREVLRLRFGLDGQGPKTLREIGERFRLTRERIRQIERQAMARLREHLGDTGAE
jgi:RNA polymerase sigma factor (sigma-70 family)